MRTCLAALTVVLILLVTTADRVACPDGCADTGSEHPTTSTSLCGLCHGWSEPRPAVSLAPAAMCSAALPAAEPNQRAAYPPAIDHPPRLA